jgi:hypothetical protein
MLERCLHQFSVEVRRAQAKSNEFNDGCLTNATTADEDAKIVTKLQI